MEDWPEIWRQHIEPKIIRGPVSEGDHWYWNGSIKDGFPVIATGPKGRQILRTVSSIIVCLFWEVPGDLRPRQWYVDVECGYRNCANPHHFIPQMRFTGDPYE